MSMIKIQIKSYWGSILFEREAEDYTLKKAMQDAVLQGADLQDAVLRGADLRGAVLQDADLRGADLRGADLQDAVLRGAVLRGIDFDKLPQEYINSCSRDMLFIFEHLKEELPFLRERLVVGEISGTQYEGDCACLIGTLANANGGISKVCKAIPFYDKGLHNPGEQWFWQIRKGDTPENSGFAKHALALIDSVVEPKKAKKVT